MWYRYSIKYIWSEGYGIVFLKYRYNVSVFIVIGEDIVWIMVFYFKMFIWGIFIFKNIEFFSFGCFNFFIFMILL